MIKYVKIRYVRYQKNQEKMPMKKLIVIIIILLMIFLGMYVYKQNKITNNQNMEVSVEEINKIETYLQKIYMWKEITGDALPIFDNINDAPDVWLWEVVKKNLEEYELTYQQLQDKTTEIFGEDLQKEFPKEGYEYMEYDEETDTYFAIGSGLDDEEDVFLLDKIQKSDNGYTVQIVEYLEDYSEGYETTDADYNIQIKNLKDETIGEVKSTESETNIQQFVKDNIDSFTKKEVNLKTDENGKIYVTSIRNIESENVVANEGE